MMVGGTNELFESTRQRLAMCGYDVIALERGYIVRHMIDSRDTSYIHHLEDLCDLADLWEWARKKQNVLIMDN
jgi:hypothetical protein